MLTRRSRAALWRVAVDRHVGIIVGFVVLYPTYKTAEASAGRRRFIEATHNMVEQIVLLQQFYDNAILSFRGAKSYPFGQHRL